MVGDNNCMYILDLDIYFVGLKISVLFEVEGVGYYFFFYVGNLDIMILVVFKMVESLVLKWKMVV